jgi:hypothetical protein
MTEPAAAKTPAKLAAPVPLTDRERSLLDRVEQLEKRVADLESKGQNATPLAGEPASSIGATMLLTSTTATATSGAELNKSSERQYRRSASRNKRECDSQRSRPDPRPCL